MATDNLASGIAGALVGIRAGSITTERVVTQVTCPWA